MSIINTSLPSSLASTLSDSQQALGRSLIGLSAGVQSADTNGVPDLGSNLPPSAGAVASQNLLSALADPVAAAAANRSAAAAIAAQPATALSTQGNLGSDAVWGLLQQND